MGFQTPYKIYTAETNVEAHMIRGMLEAQGIAAQVEEDQSGVSLWMLGTLPQYHQPNVWIEQADAAAAAKLIEDFERRKKERLQQRMCAGEIEVACEECGAVSMFASSLIGTTRECSRCGAYVDVGDLPWDDESGESESL